MSQLHVNQIRGFLQRTYGGLIDISDVQKLQEVDRESVLLSRSLAAFAISHFAGLEPADAASAVTDGSGDNGVDALHYDRASRTLFVVQSKWFGDGHGSFDVPDTGKVVQGFRDLVNQRLDRFNEKVRSKKAVIEEAFLADKASYVLVLVHTGQEDIASAPRCLLDDCLSEFNDWKDDTAPELLEVRVLKQRDLYGMVARGTQGDPVDLEVLVNDYGQVTNPFGVYGQVEAVQVAEWWSKHYPQIVEPNIRRFLGADTDVNTGLLSTLLNEPEHFWHFNNGLTVVCQKISRKLPSGAGRSTLSIICQGASIVNGAQTAGCIAAAFIKNPEAVAHARVQARFISIEGVDTPGLASAITKATNTQNRINRQDFIALDPEQERLRQELAVEGIVYHYKSGEVVVRNEMTFDLEEATLALACANSDLAFSTQAKREIGRLWEDTTKAPYKAIFNGGTSSPALWRHVRVMRIIDAALQAHQTVTEGREKGFAVHGNRFIAHHVFRRLPLQSTNGATLPLPTTPEVQKLVGELLTAATTAGNVEFPGAYLAQLFKIQAKLVQISGAMETGVASQPIPQTNQDQT